MLKLEIGKVVQNKHGHYTKIIDLRNGFVYFNGWHLKEDEAKKRNDNNGNQPINETAFARAIGKEVKAAENNGDDANNGGGNTDEVKASDAVKAFAAENDIDLATVTGTGANGNIVKKDVEAAIKARDEEAENNGDEDEDESDDDAQD